ncbi:hypothetical protein BGX27_006472 [Mortierella sp. AM989]|nr:hypothetical protein BGX27_006472 [Mortierella sp. AM989]
METVLGSGYQQIPPHRDNTLVAEPPVDTSKANHIKHSSFSSNRNSTQDQQVIIPLSPLNHSQYNNSNSSHHRNSVAEDNDPTICISNPAKALVLQTLTTLSTIVFTAVPVVVSGGADESWGHWYTWKDACRFIEPLCSGLLHYWFFYNSDLMRRWHDDSSSHNADKNKSFDKKSTSTPRSRFSDSRRFKSVLSVVFTFFLMVYVTGAMIHTAAALFKNTISIFLDQHSRGIGLSTHPLTNGDGRLSVDLALQLREGYLLIQDEWEHNISHYIYAFGALGMSWCEMIAYSGHILPEGVNLARLGEKVGTGEVYVKLTMNGSSQKNAKSSKWLVLLWVVAGVLYGGIVAGVACQYPKGLYIGSAYVVLMLLVVCVCIIYTTGSLFSLGRHYILQTYMIGGVVAAVAIIIYIAANGFDMLTSNDKSHLGSLRPPSMT